MNTRAFGDVAVAQAIQWFTTHDYIVSVPFTESSPYDLLVNKRGSFKIERVQCKRTEVINGIGNPQIGLRTLGGNQSWGGVVKTIDKKEVDVVWCSYKQRCWKIPSEILHQQSSVSLGNKYSSYEITWE